MLQVYLRDALAKLDSQIEGKVAPLERMKRLLTAQDKKATLLEMAGTHSGPSRTCMHRQGCKPVTGTLQP